MFLKTADAVLRLELFHLIVKIVYNNCKTYKLSIIQKRTFFSKARLRRDFDSQLLLVIIINFFLETKTLRLFKLGIVFFCFF